MTTKQFIEKSIKKHGKYCDYSKVVYVNSSTEVTIICPNHGEFKQKPSYHLSNKTSCPECSGKCKLSTEEWIKKAKKIHGEKYDYSKVEYINDKSKVTIICSIHGKFEQVSTTHIHQKSGCPKCRYIKSSQKRKTPIKKWINEVNEIHNNKYNYSKVNYVNARTKVTIICPEHGDFEQTPSQHKNNKAGCNECYKKTIKGKKQSKRVKNTEDFKIKVKQIHGDKYDYSKTIFVNRNTPVIVICKKEKHEFTIQPRYHYAGSGCPKCGGTYNYTTEEWVKEAVKIHGDTYDYSNVKYTIAKNKVKIICDYHGEFLSMPSAHISHRHKLGCPDCGTVRSSNSNILKEKDFFIFAKQIHGNTYDYSKVVYINGKTKITIICSQHGDFKQSPHKHISNQGCPKCGGSYNYTTEEWIEEAKKIHGDIYDYSKVKYINIKNKVIIICKKHGEFKKFPSQHKNNKAGCPICNMYQTEGILKIFLEQMYSENYQIIFQYTPEWCINPLTGRHLQYDFLLKHKKTNKLIIIELDGHQHIEHITFFHKTEDKFLKHQDRDIYKMNKALEHNISIIRIYQPDVWGNKNNWETELKNKIKSINNPNIYYVGDKKLWNFFEIKDMV